MERRHLGARRRGDDAARSLRRALGHDRAGAHSRARPAWEKRDETGRRRRHRLRQHQRGLSEAAKTFPILDIVALADAQSRGGGGARRPNSACRRARSTRCSPIRRSRSSSTSPCRRRMSRSAWRRSPPASTSIRKSRSASRVAEARALIEAAAAKGLRVGCAPDTFLGGAHQTAASASTRARSAGRSAAPPSSCARATSAGIRTPASTTSPAAARCSTWAPTTSPTSSTCSARSRASPASPRGLRGERVITSEPLAGTRIPVEVATHVAGTLQFVVRRRGHR